MEQMRGIEPPYQPWQGRVLPLNYICIKMAVQTGLEPATPSVTGRYANQLRHWTRIIKMEQMRGIEPPYQPWQGRVLPLNYICIKMAVQTGLEPATPSVTGRYANQLRHWTRIIKMEQMRGIEPPYQPWQGRVLPLNYICIKMAVQTGLEPATPSVTGRYANQLRHWT